MKLLFASDLHGDVSAVKELLKAFEKEGADRLVLLGDLLYHGPRNDLPSAYDPKGVIALLNENKDVILAVRGNCDTEVDQMVLELPILADYAVLPLSNGGLAYLTHGHRYNEQTPPPMTARDILIHGHTHVAGVTKCRDGQACLNPGSVSMPKGNTPPCYMVLEDRTFCIKYLKDGSEYASFEA
ncbi:MAG: phosphodiesterase [Clostridia bacterium]|nr:phosphodiesterase [Clostridia bacterium]